MYIHGSSQGEPPSVSNVTNLLFLGHCNQFDWQEVHMSCDLALGCLGSVLGVAWRPLTIAVEDELDAPAQHCPVGNVGGWGVGGG